MSNNFKDDQNLLNCSDIGSPDCKVAVLGEKIPSKQGETITTVLTSIAGLSNGFVWNLVSGNLDLIGLTDDIIGLSRTCFSSFFNEDWLLILLNWIWESS